MLELLQSVLVILKAMGLIDLSWGAVFIPLYVWAAARIYVIIWRAYKQVKGTGTEVRK